MKINFEFLPQGAKLTVNETYFEYSAFNNTQKWLKENTLILDTGNLLMTGVIDHHQPIPEVAESCVTSIVVRDAEKYIGHLKNLEEVNIITHFIPDLDATASVYFAIKFLEGKTFGEKEALLADYVLEVDSGKLSIDPENPLGIASLWLAVTDEKTEKRPWERDNKALIERGIVFFNEIVQTMDRIPNPKHADFGREIQGFDAEKQKINEDIVAYRADLSERSSIHSVNLLNSKDGGTAYVDAIFTIKPQSFLWKYWVRGDRKNSRGKQGFIFTCAHWERRSIISVDPNTSFNLKGLGILIDRAEIDKLLTQHAKEDIELGFLDNEDKRPGLRPGFQRNDPWYDGRGFQNYTIIDAPRAGTQLTEHELENLMLNVPLWTYYGEAIDQKVTHLSLDELLALPAPIFEGADPLDSLVLPDNFNETELDPHFQQTFMEILFRAKRFSRADLLQQLRYKNVASKYTQALAIALNSLDTLNFGDLKEQYCVLICENLEAQAIISFLEKTEDLSATAFKRCISKVEKYIAKEDQFSFFFRLQQQHPRAFYSVEKGRAVAASIQSFLSTNFVSNETMFELPLYAFNNCKNYFDDMLTHQQLGEKSISTEFKAFTANDFSSIFTESGLGASLKNLFQDFKVYKDALLKNYLGKNAELIKESRNKIIHHLRGLQAKKIKQYSTEELLKLDFESLQELILLLKSSPNEDVQNFINILGFLQNLAALEHLFNRLDNFSKLCDEHYHELFENSAFFNQLNELSYTLFYSQSIYLQSSISDDSEPLLKSVLNQLNNIRTIHDSKLNIDLSTLCDATSRFILNLISELSLPFENPDQKLDECLNQYYLICGTGGIIQNLENLPYFYRQLWLDIFTAYKRFYSEKIVFLREQIIRLTELTDSTEEQKAADLFDSLYVQLINESVKYDWQELKDYVDAGNFDAGHFYDKYFYWKKLNHEKSDNFKELAKYNSALRFALGNVSTFNEKLVQQLPGIGYTDKNHEADKNLFIEQKFDQLISHLPNKFLHQCFEYISTLYINRFDVATAEKGLFSYSTRFPWYYRLFTKTYVVRFLTLFLVFMLIMAGIFDVATYEIENITENAPAADFVKNLLGEQVFTVLHYFSSGFWIGLLCISFVLPFLVLIVLSKNLILKKSFEKGLKLKFLEIIKSIESNNSNLLYMSFVIPLLFVVLQMTSSDTIGMINNITGIRLLSTFIIVIGLTIAAVFMHVREKNKYKGINWVIKRTEHMFWLHLLQAMLITVFIIDILLRLEINISNFPTHDDLFSVGISKFIRFEIGPFDFIVMPIFTVMVSLLTLFFSFFIDKVLGNK